MGSKYTSQSVSGFNASPPSDDGSTAASNKVLWSTIKTKLNDPLNTAIAAVNSALVTAFDYSARSVTSADSTVASDHMRTLEVPSTVTSTFTISLGDAATMANGYIVRVRNSSAVGITVGRATVGDTLDGAAANKLLPPGATGIYAVNAAATGYVTLAYAGPVRDTDAVVAGGTDGTKKLRFEVDGFTTATTRVLTPPDYDGTIATLAGTETLTNKTLGAVTLAGAVTGGGQTVSGLGTTTVGTGSGTSAGLIVGYSGISGYGAIWSTGVTPSTSNYSLLTNGSATQLNGSSAVNIAVNNTAVAQTSSAAFFSGTDNGITLGKSDGRWSVVYAGTGTINTSDAREKTAVRAFTASEIAAAKDLSAEIGAFQFLDAVAKKGDAARMHIGMTVQRAIAIMESHGLDPFAYGFICFDEWAESTDKDGKVKPAGNRHGFRPDELMLFIARGFHARLAALEA